MPELLDSTLERTAFILFVIPLTIAAIVASTRRFRLWIGRVWLDGLRVQAPDADFPGISFRLVVPVRAFLITLAAAVAVALLITPGAPNGDGSWYRWITPSALEFATLAALIVGGISSAIADSFSAPGPTSLAHATIRSWIPRGLTIPILVVLAVAAALFAVALRSSGIGDLSPYTPPATSPALLFLALAAIVVIVFFVAAHRIARETAMTGGTIWGDLSRRSTLWLFASISGAASLSSIHQSLQVVADSIRVDLVGTALFGLVMGITMVSGALATSAPIWAAVVGLQLAPRLLLRRELPALYRPRPIMGAGLPEEVSRHV